MQDVQLALGTAPYASALCDLLLRAERWQIATVSQPDPKKKGVLVVNEETLDSLPLPIERPERIVLITSSEASHLERAWQVGIRTVVFNSDPPRTIALAVMAAALRVRSDYVAMSRGPGTSRKRAQKAPKQNCNECLRLEGLLKESERDYLAAANRYNTWCHIGLGNSWAAKALKTAKLANADRRREFDEHLEHHDRPVQQPSQTADLFTFKVAAS